MEEVTLFVNFVHSQLFASLFVVFSDKHAHTQTHNTYAHRHSNSEAETTLTTTNNVNDYVNIQTPVSRDTIDELYNLLGALETATSAVQAQLDAQVATNIGRRFEYLVCLSCLSTGLLLLLPHLRYSNMFANLFQN